MSTETLVTAIPSDGYPQSFALWNLYDPQSREALCARLVEIVKNDGHDPALAAAVIMAEFDHISHTAGPGESRYAKHEPGAHDAAIACAQCPT